MILKNNIEKLSINFNRQLKNLDNLFEKNDDKISRGCSSINEEVLNSILNMNNIDYIYDKEISQEINNEKTDLFHSIKNSNDNKNYSKYYKEDLTYTNFIHSLDNSFYNNYSILNKEFSINKEENEIIINKKRRLFNVVYPNTFFIFNKGGNDHYIRNYIEKSIKPLQNSKKEYLFPFIKGKREKCKRKHNADNIRKKIKAKFLKSLRIQVNKKLTLGGSKKNFNYLQQIFISNISRQFNGRVLDLTFQELFSINFCKGDINDGHSNLQKYIDNISVIKYLEERPEISKKSNYKLFKDIKYYQIFDEYLRSKEFENEIYRLKRKYKDNYINKYINLAINLNDYFYH